MAMIPRFEDIQAWQEARQLLKIVYELTSTGTFAKDFDLRDQIQRASVSAMTNAPDTNALAFVSYVIITL
jgi:hypothetical protein